ncbi:MAG: lipoyl synthase [Candidatus Brocadiia bacterium]
MTSSPRRFPPWLSKRIPPESRTEPVRQLLGRLRVGTVCQSAHCPNLFECFARGTATFLILGNVCTRNCRFCAIAHGEPQPPDPEEPCRVAEAAAQLRLRHVVITSVTRDDLPDGGSGHFAATIAAVGDATGATIEVLTPDFQGAWDDLDTVLEARPDVLNHNLETVPRLYPRVRPQALYSRSLALLRAAVERGPGVATKSGLMVGLGERPEEVVEVFRDLRQAGCAAVTVGQYLRPSAAHLAVEEFVTPDQFETYQREAERLGFSAVACGPFVRSSYHAEAMQEALACAAT